MILDQETWKTVEVNNVTVEDYILSDENALTKMLLNDEDIVHKITNTNIGQDEDGDIFEEEAEAYSVLELLKLF